MNRIVASLLFIFCGGVSQAAFACSCVPRDIEELYRNADIVYFAQVTLVRLVTKAPPHNAQANYAMELRPMRLFKGRDPGIQGATYMSTYHDNSPQAVDSEEEGRAFVINSCDKRYEIGQVVLIFQKRNVPLGKVGFCTPTFVSGPSAEHLLVLQRLSQ